ncbi:MAG: sigma-70 family RNA polymerase sigma factor [Armatimonadota bacterium]
MSTKDHELVAKAKNGDRASFDALVREHYRLVYNTAYRMMSDHEAAEDATQAAFVRAFGAIERFRGTAAFSTWLYRIVTNVCLDMLRARRDDVDSLEIEYDEDEAHRRPLPDESAEPASRAQQVERQRVVHEAIGRLTPQYRAVIVLYDIRGFSYEEISDILEVPLGTVKSRLSRARDALKDEIGSSVELFLE